MGESHTGGESRVRHYVRVGGPLGEMEVMTWE